MARLLAKVDAVADVVVEAFEEGPNFAEADDSSFLLAQWDCVGCSHDAPYGLVRVDDSVGLVTVMTQVNLLDEAETLVLARSLFRCLPCEVTHPPLRSVASGSSLPALMPPLWRPWQRRLELETRRMVDAYSMALHRKIVGN